MESAFTIRSCQPNDFTFLREMFYHSLFVPTGEEPFPKSILDEPGLRKYLHAWGRPTDHALILIDQGERVGASWSRLFTSLDPSYGFVDEHTPELGIAIAPSHRGRGGGTLLLNALLDLLIEKGTAAVSLSVAATNPAFRLYQRLGFEIVNSDGTTHTMLKQL